MQEVVGIKFNSVGATYYFAPNGFNLKLNDAVIVSTENGLEYGIVSKEKFELEDEKIVSELKNVVRIATEKDKDTLKEREQKQIKVLEQAKQIVAKHKLEMKLISAEYSFDFSKVIFAFTADGRVDFRELVKEFAGTFRARIELKQVGIRDEAKILGGLGPCGRKICCANHLRDIGKVSVKMAKNQNLSLNPASISGVCGRLMCCLSFEDGDYVATLKEMPKINSKVKTPDGEGTVSYNNILKKLVSVKIVNPTDNSYKIVEYPLNQIEFKVENNG